MHASYNCTMFYQHYLLIQNVICNKFFSEWNSSQKLSFMLNTLCNLSIETNLLSWWHSFQMLKLQSVTLCIDLIIIKLIKEFIMWILKIDMAWFSTYQYSNVLYYFCYRQLFWLLKKIPRSNWVPSHWPLDTSYRILRITWTRKKCFNFDS